MSERFWAPTRATIEPDAVAIALMSPHGEDAAGDLGASLLGMHRAGAAACEVVAKGAVPSEKRLAEVLSTCRAAMGGQATDAVSKSMEERYAGLLVRDLLDDADAAAVSLFRTCVAKGVAPPLAASRAGAVYGVPMRELGRYQALAADPRVNPTALTDAADRALLGYVSKVVAEEAGETKEEVSKAPTAHARQTGDSDEGWDEREHPRSPYTGQFVRTPDRTAKPVKTEPREPVVQPPSPVERLRAKLGLGQRGPERVAEIVDAPAPVQTPVQTPTRAPARPAQRKTQKTRKTRRPQLVPTGQKVQPGQIQRGQIQRGQLQRGQIQRAALEQKLQIVRSVREQLGARSFAPALAAEGVLARGKEMEPGKNLMEKPAPFSTGAEFYDTYVPLIFNVGADEGAQMRSRAAGSDLSDDPRRLRAGWLIEYAGTPEYYDEESREDSPAELSANHIADVVRFRAEDSNVEAPHIQELDERYTDGNEGADYARGMRKMMAKDAPWVHDEAEARFEAEHHIDVMPELHTGKMVLVHAQPETDVHGRVKSITANRTVPVLEQYVLMGESFKGREEGTGKHVDYVLDPNQALAISQDYEDFWDSRRQVIVRRYQLRPLSEAEVREYDQNAKWEPGTNFFGKALDGVEAVQFEQAHPRDAEGKFAPKESAPSRIAPSALPTPVQRLRAKLGLEGIPVTSPTPAPTKSTAPRTTRKTRKTRSARPVQQVIQRPANTLERPKLKPSPLVQRAMITRQQRQPLQLQQRALVNIQRTLTERNKAIPDLPALDPDSDFRVLSPSEWSQISDYIADDDLAALSVKGGQIPFISTTARVILERQSGMLGDAERWVIDRAVESTLDNALEGGYPDEIIGKPFLLGESEDEERALGHRIADAFDENPHFDQIIVMRDPHSHQVQLMGNRMPASTQTLIEIDPSINVHTDGLMLMNVGTYRSKQVSISRTESRHFADSTDQSEGTGAFNVPVRVLRVVAPKVHYRRVVED